MRHEQVIAAYRAAWETTRQMLAAAQHEDWERLLELEQSRDAQLAAYLQTPDFPVADREAAGGLMLLMRNMLAADQQIQCLTQTWMEEIQGVMSSVQVEQKLLKAYDPL